jgi:CubicO group peptidase (beta-lactamase class C family)
MQKRKKIGLAILAAAVPAAVQIWLSIPGPAAAFAQQTPPQLSDFLRSAVARGDVPGVVALVVNREGVIYHEAFGKQNVAAGIDMPKDAIFRIASMTKPLTSMAVMMLAAEGTLNVDDEVGRYVPELKNPQVLVNVNDEAGTFETKPASRPITIRQLLTHTSGIAYAFSSPPLALYQKVTGEVNPLKQPLVHEPGERWTYGASTRVLGLIVEKVTGQRIDRFLDERIHRPLGMVDTSFEVPREKYGRVVTTHQRLADGTFRETPNADTLSAPVQGDGGLFSTAADYGRFVQMLVHEGRFGPKRLAGTGLLSRMTRNQMGDIVVQTQPSTNPNLSKPFPAGAGADTWGFGFQITAADSTKPALRSPGSYTWAGIFNTHFWVDPGREIGVVFLTQTLPFYDEKVMQVMAGFEELVYRHLN